ncbi:MAG: hypothetical protein KA260_05595 [Burkholderiales bacterium]|nr:hypothetical protein [Burkholderiales bacterium]
MQVWIKSLEVDMQVKQKGIELEVRNPDGVGQIGDCYATMTGLTWCHGRTAKENGIKISWGEFQTICESAETLKAAVSAAKSVTVAKTAKKTKSK